MYLQRSSMDSAQQWTQVHTFPGAPWGYSDCIWCGWPFTDNFIKAIKTSCVCFLWLQGQNTAPLSLTLLELGEEHPSSCVGRNPRICTGRSDSPCYMTVRCPKPRSYVLKWITDASGVCPSLRPLSNLLLENLHLLLPLCWNVCTPSWPVFQTVDLLLQNAFIWDPHSLPNQELGQDGGQRNI